MSHENKSQSSFRPLQLMFTRAQQQALSSLLPQNYTLELLSKLKKESHRPTKKLFTNEGNAIPKIATPVEEPPVTAAPSEHNASPSTKRTLRDKKPGKSYLEDKFQETAPLSMPSVKPVAKPSVEATKRCSNLLQRLKKHNCVGPFLHPVDVEGLGLYNYYDIIKEPMDISTVEKQLKNGEYSSVHEFGNDIRKIWSNALLYNTEGSSIYIMTQKIQAYFEKIFKEIEDVQFTDKVKDLEEKVKNLTRTLTDLTRTGTINVNPVKPSKPASKLTKSPYEEEMSIQEKKVLCDHIKKLPADALRGVWEIVSRGLPNQSDKEELIFDIDVLPVKVTRELDRFIKNYLANNKSGKAKPKEPAAKSSANKNSHTGVQQNHNRGSASTTNGVSQGNVHTNAQPVVNKPLISNPPPPKQQQQKSDADSKSSDSSFISDSDSGSDDDRRHKAKTAQNYHMKQQDLANFQAGSHGSMINSFIVK